MARDEPPPHVTTLDALVSALRRESGGIFVVSLPHELMSEALRRGVLEADAFEQPFLERTNNAARALAETPLAGIAEITASVAADPSSEPSQLLGSTLRVAAAAPLLALEYEGDRGLSRVLITRDTYPCDGWSKPFFPAAQPVPDVELAPGPWRWTTARAIEGEWTPTAHGGCFRTFNDAIADAQSVTSIERVVDFMTETGQRPISSNPTQLRFDFRTPSLYKRFSGRGAPVPGEKGYRAPPLDGRSRGEIARTAFANATRYLHDPDFFYLVDPDWLLEWGFWVDSSAYDDPEELRQNKEDFADWLELPYTDVKGRPVSVDARSDFAHYVYALAKVVDGSAGSLGSTMSSMSAKAESFGDAYPAWAAVGEIEDALQGEGRSRLVFVPRKTAYAFVKEHHSKLGEGHRMPPGTMYSIGVMVGDDLVAVATAGHPTGAPMRRGPRGATPRSTLQLTRVASDGSTKNAASMLVGRILDLLDRSSRDPSAPSLFITYSILGEPGAPYRALRDKGLRPVCITSPAAPSGSRAGGDGLSRLPKIRWEAGPDAAPAAWDILTTGRGPRCKGLFG